VSSAVESVNTKLAKVSCSLEAVREHYDVIVIGAGPAGSITARELAVRGASVLLIDKSQFPRAKVCGCCLSAAALKSLRSCGLGDLPARLGAVPIHSLQLCSGTMTLDTPLTEELSISRQLLDAALITEATNCGAHFLPRTAAAVEKADGQKLFVIAIAGEDTRILSAKLVVAADGLGGVSTQNFPELATVVDPLSRIGMGTVSEQAPSFYQPGTIYMTYGDGGYLGLVRLEDGRLDIAAALNSEYLKSCHTAPAAARELLNNSHWPVPLDLDQLAWKGTVPLTRTRESVATERLFLVGDAASYVEPFTGEGIAWAIQSALLLAPLLTKALNSYDESFIWRWQHIYRRSIVRAQRPTKLVAQLLRNPQLTTNTVDVLIKAPFISKNLVRLVTGALKKSPAHAVPDEQREVSECQQS
jgi:menaquinone-9 beta-reductase